MPIEMKMWNFVWNRCQKRKMGNCTTRKRYREAWMKTDAMKGKKYAIRREEHKKSPSIGGTSVVTARQMGMRIYYLGFTWSIRYRELRRNFTHNAKWSIIKPREERNRISELFIKQFPGRWFYFYCFEINQFFLINKIASAFILSMQM